MDNTFESKVHLKMNWFLGRLKNALKNLPDNPKPSCTGFYLCDYDHDTGLLIAEQIGIIPEEKKAKYFQFAIKKVMQTLSFGKTRSKEFENNALEQYPGAIKLYLNCAGVSGHDSMVDEAISVLWLITKELQGRVYDDDNYEFWLEVFGISLNIQKELVPDNKWISIIAKLITDSVPK
ncbi:MAG: hypothetical protein US50_C0012G0002 [Candidatus Nomurabacteria bacterium GW2011_GWB1_37_5]|uniref:Uncharacterized protein n=1 Tax=Candidatus Nomurabacteria bacterium GW2011_GWB1_37_5 TaxID=1618742 RepID=A0A0G0GZW0_9BACT|nr:MAG: hypothetical protein US50_C0012G0002 [Candidatus Nomurabacteria bacterium GW2011_GWB1_37_5]